MLMACIAAGACSHAFGASLPDQATAPRPAAAQALTTPQHHVNLAVFDGNDPPMDLLQAFDAVVLDPARSFDPAVRPLDHTIYVARTTAQPGESADSFIRNEIAPLWQRGFRGFVLDTPAALQALEAIRAAHPDAAIVLGGAGATDTARTHAGDVDAVLAGPFFSESMATSADAPAMGTIYKLVELDVGCGIKRFTAKLSQDKATLPGAKQLFRFEGHDILARSGECSNGQAMLRPVVLGGELVEPLPDLNAARANAAASLAKLPASLRSLDPAEPWPIRHSKDLAALIERTRSNLA